jgi:hypothetical protein
MLRAILKNVAIFLAICALLNSCSASDWNEPARQLARKIAAVTGPGAIVVTTENRSSLPAKDFDAISSSLRVELETSGARPVQPEQAAGSVAVTLSENPSSYLLIAEIREGTAEPVVVMVNAPRNDDEIRINRDALPLTLRKTSLWAQEDRILDVVVLDEDTAPRHIAVLGHERISIYRQKNGKWQPEQSFAISHTHAWPRDLRGRLIPTQDHLFDVYLPGMFCRTSTGSPLTLSCRESDDPWPLRPPTFVPLAQTPSVQPLGGFYSTSRNFFTGALTPGVGKLSNVAKFYSAAALPRSTYTLWLFAGTDGQTYLVDGVTEQSTKLSWGSDLASVKTGCGAGWQILATSDGSSADGTDSIRAYEITDRDPTPMSAPLDFPGEITALWTEPKGDRAIAIIKKTETGEYEAFRVALACSL